MYIFLTIAMALLLSTCALKILTHDRNRPNYIHCIDQSKANKIETAASGLPHIQILHSSEANEDCPGQGFPAILVSYHGPEKHIGFIHIVEVNTKKQHGAFQLVDLKSNKDQWIFVDGGSLTSPFYSQGNVFFDNPAWTFPNDLLSDNLQWRGVILPTVINNNKIQILGGIEWGFTLKRKTEGVQSIDPAYISQGKLQHIIDLLKTHYLDWEIKKFSQD